MLAMGGGPKYTSKGEAEKETKKERHSPTSSHRGRLERAPTGVLQNAGWERREVFFHLLAE